MKFLVYIFLFLFVKVSFAQKDFTDTIWFDSNWKESSKKAAFYYRIYKKSGNIYLVYDKFLNGQNQMVAEASDLKPDLLSEGYSIYFKEDGKIEKHGYCKNDLRIGNWVYYYNNGKDSAIWEYHEGNVIHRRGINKLLDDVYTVTEYMPEYPGGIHEMVKFIQNNIVYPKSLNYFNVGGKVYLKFVISPEGDVHDIQVLKSSGFIEMDNEAKRIVALMPKWTPGKQAGKNVPVYFNLPISFSLKYPYFIYNVSNESNSYQKTRNIMHEGGSPLSIADILEKEADREKNTDVLYNLGVAYFHSNKKKKACENFSKILKITNENITIVNNSKLFLENHCSN